MLSEFFDFIRDKFFGIVCRRKPGKLLPVPVITPDDVPGPPSRESQLPLVAPEANPQQELSPPSPEDVPHSPTKKSGNAFKNFYEGSKAILLVLNGPAGALPPLKMTVTGLISIFDVIDTYLENKKGLEGLESKIDRFRSIVQHYESNRVLRKLEARLGVLNVALSGLEEKLKPIKERSEPARVLLSSADKKTIEDVISTLSGCLEEFQFHTHLEVEVNIAQLLQDRIFERLKYIDDASYNARSYRLQDEQDCWEGTRKDILDRLDNWAFHNKTSRVCWLNGMAGTGKSTIAATFSKRLQEKRRLGARFFCYHLSKEASQPRHIVPHIANELGESSPRFRAAICEILNWEKEVVSAMPDKQFSSLILKPYKDIIGESAPLVKDVTCEPVHPVQDTTPELVDVVIIDAIDECLDQFIAMKALIDAALTCSSDIPLKFFITSRNDTQIQSIFQDSPNIDFLTTICLDGDSNVQKDIEKYLWDSLSAIKSQPPFGQLPGDLEGFKRLLKRSDRLFIYAATAIRYIKGGLTIYRERLRDVTQYKSALPSRLQTNDVDELYQYIIDRAFSAKLFSPQECSRRSDVLAAVVCFQTPLSMRAIASLLALELNQTDFSLSPLHSVIHVPDTKGGLVSIFHQSFREFMVSDRCSSARMVDTRERHRKLTIECLEYMNNSPRRNICNLPECIDCIDSDGNQTPRTHDIPEALRYSCLYWASHLALAIEKLEEVLEPLTIWGDKHLLHWFECLGALGQLESGFKSLDIAREAISKHPSFSRSSLLFHDARRCLQMGFGAIQHHCVDTYHFAFTWVPRNSMLRKQYTPFLNVPQVVGLPESWAPLEQIMQHRSPVSSVAFSMDGTRIASGSDDKTVQIWNAATGESEFVLEHLDWVTSVVFSPDGNRVISGSDDNKIRIWNATKGKSANLDMELDLGEHSGIVSSVALSPAGGCIAFGSYDSSVHIWNVNTTKHEPEHVLTGHSDVVSSVAFSPNGTRLVSGSDDNTAQIWDVAAGRRDHVLYHSDCVTFVAFSSDGKLVVTGSDDSTVRIWNPATGELKDSLKGHSGTVTSIAFSLVDRRLMSGSDDGTIRIWDMNTGRLEHMLEGHSGAVSSIAFSPKDSHVVSGSYDSTVRIWNTTKTEEGPYDISEGRVGPRSNNDEVPIWDSMTGNHISDTSQLRFDSFLERSQGSHNQKLYLSEDHEWIHGSPMGACWIAPPYRDFEVCEVSGYKICFGYGTGRLVVVDLG